MVLGWNRKTSRATVCGEAPGFSARGFVRPSVNFFPELHRRPFLALLSQNLVKRDTEKVDAQAI
jgi:hypothetical protein